MSEYYRGLIFDSKGINSENNENNLTNSDEQTGLDESNEQTVKSNSESDCMMCYNSFSYNLGTYGTLSKDGDLTNFVAENLECKIKLSNLMNTGLNEIPQPNKMPNLIQRHLNVLNDIEIEAQYLAANVDNLTENLGTLLHSVSSITADNVDLYKNGICKLADCMDANIKSMYTIMAKTEEMSKAMKPTEKIAQKIREIKRLVDIFESNL